MKKLFVKDSNLRTKIKNYSKNYFVLKSIIYNKQFFLLVRYKSYLKLKKLIKNYFIISISNRCINTVNKKNFNKFTLFSRFIYLKLIRNNQLHGFQKSSW